MYDGWSNNGPEYESFLVLKGEGRKLRTDEIDALPRGLVLQQALPLDEQLPLPGLIIETIGIDVLGFGDPFEFIFQLRRVWLDGCLAAKGLLQLGCMKHGVNGRLVR